MIADWIMGILSFIFDGEVVMGKQEKRILRRKRRVAARVNKKRIAAHVGKAGKI